MKNVKFTATDLKKMNRQNKVYRGDGGAPAWRKASDLAFLPKEQAISKINVALSASEIKEVKDLLNAG